MFFSEESLCSHKWKVGPVLLSSWIEIKGSWTSRSHTCFIAASSSLQLSKCLSVKSSQLFKCKRFRVACFCDFSHRREVQLGALLLYTPQFLYVTDRFVIEHVISLRTCSYLRLSILSALYFIPTDASNLLRYGRVGFGVLKSLNR